MSRLLLGILLTALMIETPCSAEAQGAEEEYVRRDSTIHSDLPLWGGEDLADDPSSKDVQEIYPQHFYGDDGSFGCMTAVRMGDWRYFERDFNEDEEKLEAAAWFRLANQGVFHCATRAAQDYADELEEANLDGGSLALFVKLGTVGTSGRVKELWAVQMGFLPGSDYLLLSRDPKDDGIREFDVLQRVCPKAKVRTAGAIDSFLTEYCAINSRDDLVALAHSMAKRDRLGVLKWLGASD